MFGAQEKSPHYCRRGGLCWSERTNAGDLGWLSRFFTLRLVAVEDVQFLAGFEADSLAGRNGYFCPGARVAADAGLAWAHVEDAEATQFDAVAVRQSLFKALKNCVDRSFSLHAR